MSDAIIVRRGSTGGPSPDLALLHINAPVGSTITLAKGGVTVKVLDANKGHISAKTNDYAVFTEYADWYYSVSSRNYGEWTVTATLINDTKSVTVTVESNKQYDINLTYDLYFIRDGKLVLATDPAVTSGGIIIQEVADGLEIRAPGNSYSMGIKITSALLGGISFSKLVIDFAYLHPANNYIYCGIANNFSGGTGSNWAVVLASSSSIQQFPYHSELDTSSIALTDKYFGIRFSFAVSCIIINAYLAR